MEWSRPVDRAETFNFAVLVTRVISTIMGNHLTTYNDIKDLL